MFGHATYLLFELGWCLPVVALHWLLDARRLARRLRLIVGVTSGVTAYLTLADSVAIHSGIWSLHASRLTGLSIGNVPIEESIFFAISNLMVVQSLILLRPKETTLSLTTPNAA